MDINNAGDWSVYTFSCAPVSTGTMLSGALRDAERNGYVIYDIKHSFNPTMFQEHWTIIANRRADAP